MADQEQLGFLDDHAELFFGRHVYHACAQTHIPRVGNYIRNAHLGQNPRLPAPYPAGLLCGIDNFRVPAGAIQLLSGVPFRQAAFLNRQEKYKALNKQSRQ